MSWSRWVTAAAVIAGLGCATERPAINRVQPNALEKSFFVGPSLRDTSDDPEFFSAATIIDVPYSANHGATLFSGWAGGLLGRPRETRWSFSGFQFVIVTPTPA